MTTDSYGQVAFNGRTWRITCEPQVRSRLKRVFPRVPQGAANHVDLVGSPENSRELLWFLQRYPMTMEAEVQAALEHLAARHVEMEQSLAALVAGRLHLPAFELAKPPREYQRYAGAQVAIRGGLLVADDLGLGKTVTGMCPLAIPENLPAVVVYPAALPNHWPEKLAEFVPNLRVHHIRKGQPYPLIRQPRQRIIDLWDTLPDVILVSYHKLRGWAETLAEIVQYAVFEECQQLRSPDSDIYRACCHLAEHARLRMGLTATPIYNYGSEFYHVVNPLIPDCLGGYDEFLREWCIGSPGEKPKLRDAEQFGTYLRREGIMLRRTRAEVGRELPALSKIPHEIESDSRVLENITGDAVALAKTILKANEAFSGEKMRAAGEFDRLVRQATGVAKAPYVAEFVRLLVESGQQVLLFGWHREVYGIWLEKLAAFNPVMYTGSESPKEKQAAKEAFIAGDSRVMLISLRAGAGIDGLQYGCSTVVFGELDWSPGVHEQCIGRVHRDGQAEPVQAFFLISDEGSDPIVSDVLGVKREQIEGVRNPGDNLVERRDIGENQLRQLAQRFLKEQGVAIPSTSEPAALRPQQFELT
ncbi:DEAD/DEAH box helicase [Pseudomonas kuykendallii]|uniref:Helicase conserved C-terminal domain-containing protein n=1 Tax=Pseudomonas kuykendallii TaxID=1007099 RepID=A0A1H3EN24_9PSED|nr:DEAD/DEAH box helicase [Pseudomonas kuykendallii]MCQ4271028.1 DEAD/DEAH box helicase [Pseudomonas kuykendallii]SDX80005.1 Helicase conserved C-terminal domain-containing protein [Pseudomonas kuykendallii]